MLTELELSKKRTRRELKKRRALAGRRTAGPSRALTARRWRMRLDADDLARRNEAYEAARAKSRARVLSMENRKSGFFEGMGNRLRALVPRRTGGAD